LTVVATLVWGQRQSGGANVDSARGMHIGGEITR